MLDAHKLFSTLLNDTFSGFRTPAVSFVSARKKCFYPPRPTPQPTNWSDSYLLMP